MARRVGIVPVGLVGVLLLVAGPAQAQQQEQNLTEDEVRGLFDSIEQETMESIQAGEFSRLIEFFQEKVSDGATFQLTNELYFGEEQKGFAAVTLDKEDVVRLGGAAAAMMSGMQGQPIEDYSLEVDVANISPVGSAAATVAVDYTESARLVAPASSEGSPESDADGSQTGSVAAGNQQNGSLEIRATAHCVHLVHASDADDQLTIGLTTCQARTDF